ncbi:MAG: SUMF1/EgtB/PvdO family nonheme iron enzyme, partial [Phaeodactylibacter sp.]|nr:SUMF1/EgtB/PvdO family nonheme iron enzyme [Phaeodactylibacter sp.]
MSVNPFDSATLDAALKDLLVQVPAGAITLRDDRTQARWTAQIAPFAIAKYPVTQDLYQALTGTNPSTFQGPRRPVETISWLEAARFCNQLSSRLGLEQCYRLEDTAQNEFV